MNEPRIIDQPRPGYWMIRQVKGGPEVPAAIELHVTRFEPDEPTNLMERSAYMTARIGLDYVPISDVWERKGRPITRKEYEFQLKIVDWARTHAPFDPRAQPKQPVTAEKLRTLPNIMPPRR